MTKCRIEDNNKERPGSNNVLPCLNRITFLGNSRVPTRTENPLDTMLCGLKWILTNDLKHKPKRRCNNVLTECIITRC